jgi:large conductance mechanosensitive channel
VTGVLKEFKAFVLRGNVIDLAVGIVIGVAFGALVTSFVTNVLTPIIAIPGDVPDLSKFTWRIGEGKGAAVIRYGLFLNAAIAFVMIAAAVFFFVVRPINKLKDRQKTEPDVESPTRACPECLSTIPTEARRCAFCTSEVQPPPAG